MGFTVNFSFHGTIVLVPNGDVVHVLVPEFEGKVQQKGKALVPYICFPKGAMKDREPWVTHEKKQHVVLDGEFLEIEGAKDTKLDQLFTKQSENTPRAGDFDSLGWLASPRRLVKGAKIRPELFADPFKKFTVPDTIRIRDGSTQTTLDLAARIDLRFGKLRTGGVKAALPFKSTHGVEQVFNVAREAILTFDVSGDSFTIKSRSIHGEDNRGGHDYDMSFSPPDDKKVLEMVLGNEPSRDIYASPREMAVEAGDMAKEFGLFYLLYKLNADDKPNADDLPLPLGQNKGGSTHLCANAQG